MDQAPVTIFVFVHREKGSFLVRLSSFWKRSTYLSIGTAIENMILAVLLISVPAENQRPERVILFRKQ